MTRTNRHPASWHPSRDYNVVPVSGDIPGMRGEARHSEDMIPITSAKEMTMFRNFNRASKDYAELCDLYVRGGCKGPRRLLDKASDDFSNASQDIRDHYGESVWTKWHSRTGWVIKKA